MSANDLLRDLIEDSLADLARCPSCGEPLPRCSEVGDDVDDDEEVQP